MLIMHLTIKSYYKSAANATRGRAIVLCRDPDEKVHVGPTDNSTFIVPLLPGGRTASEPPAVIFSSTALGEPGSPAKGA